MYPVFSESTSSVPGGMGRRARDRDRRPGVFSERLRIEMVDGRLDDQPADVILDYIRNAIT